MTNYPNPVVTVGLPVHNGENYLADALESILAQTLTDFELIVCDNASTDGTEIICKQFAAKDDRIKYVRNEKNLGAAKNFNLTVELAAGKYFKWAAHDDVLDNQLLEKSVVALENRPDAVLAFTKVALIDENGQVSGEYDGRLPNAGSSRPEERFGDLVFGTQLCYEVFGLIRTDVLRRTPLIGPYVTSDRNLLAELSLLGPFVEVPERLLRMRLHKTRSVAKPRHERLGWFDTDKANKVFFPYWKEYYEYLKSVRRVRLDLAAEWRCSLHVLKRIAQNWRFLRGDIRIALGNMLSRSSRGAANKVKHQIVKDVCN